MKKIVLLLMFGLVSLYAKSCMTDIYFGNGVWNTEKEAINSKRALKRFMQYQAVTQLDPQQEGETYRFAHAYNPSRGTIDDLIETFYQLKESGQIFDGYFFAIYSALAAESNGEEFLQKLQAIISTYNGDVNAMYQIYTNASFNQKHNVLLVAHSQGNLFGNKMYTLMSDSQKNKFRMVSVATPADSVAGGGPYVTASGDYIINPIPNALPSNVDGFGHTFIGTYLNSSINAPRKIALYVKGAYNNLIQTSTCTESLYEYVFIRVYETEHLEVVGYSKELKENVAIGTTDIQILRENADYCGADYYHYGLYPYFNDAHNPNYYLWNVGPFRSKDELISRKDTSLNFYLYGSYGDNCAIISLSGELYNLVLSAFGDYDESEEYVESETPPPIYMYSS